MPINIPIRMQPVSRAKRWLCTAFFSVLMALVVPAAAVAESGAQAASFSSQTVVDLARELALHPYEPPPEAPEALAKLDYSTYRQINFQQEAAIWGNTPTRFSVQLFAPGFLYKHLVDIDVVENGHANPIELSETSFRVPRPGLAKVLAQTGKFAGMRLHFPINREQYQDEFVVFQGASYFRAVSRGQAYGLSTRGLAIDVAERQGEEFPMFRRFWIERPAKQQKAIVVHALLDSPSVTGAYRFGIYPGAPTRMDVDAVLFPRRDLNHVGLAPLTSMFMHGAMVSPQRADYRPAVHDSEALAILRGNGERLWRPLNNPDMLQISVFEDQNPNGFGLIQRHRAFEDYQDLEAGYEKRPSAWVEPVGDWGKGSVQLVEIPSNAESNDNIVAYWRPAQTLKKGEAYAFSYRLTWPNDSPVLQNKVRVVRSAGGQKLFSNLQEVVLDYADLGSSELDNIVVQASISRGQITETRIQPNPAIRGGRVFVTFDPEGADVAELRVQLMRHAEPAAETWLYRWIRPSWLR